jgi:hypothetical protein
LTASNAAASMVKLSSGSMVEIAEELLSRH